MFLLSTMKKIIKEFPRLAKETTEKWDLSEGLLEDDVTNIMSPNYDPLIDPGSWYNTTVDVHD